MNESTVLNSASKPARWRVRFGMRRLLMAVLLLALGLGGLAAMQRQARQRESLFATFARERLGVHTEPTYLCLFAMKVLSTHSLGVETRCGPWIGRGWFARPVGCNAGRRSDQELSRIIGLLQPLGDVHEVHYRGGSLNGLRLLYVGKIPYGNLGPNRDMCTFRVHPTH